MLQNAKERGVQLVEVSCRLCHFWDLILTQSAIACIHHFALQLCPAPAGEVQKHSIELLLSLSRLRILGLDSVNTTSSCFVFMLHA